jgi:hypothetical protein
MAPLRLASASMSADVAGGRAALPLPFFFFFGRQQKDEIDMKKHNKKIYKPIR